VTGPLPFDLAVPADWTVIPFGRLVSRSQRSGRPDARSLSVFIDQGVVPRDSRGDNFNRLGADLNRYLVVRKGDIVFNKLRTWQGGLGISEFDGIVSPAYFVCRPTKLADSRYLHFLLRSRPYLDELTRISKWMPPSQFDISWDDLRRLPIMSPPVGVQRAIAHHLDQETARIDALIAAKRRMAELLEQRMLLAAYEQTTADGDELPLRRLLHYVKTGGTPPGYEFERLRDGGLPWYSPADVGKWLDLYEPERTLKSEAVTEGIVPRFPPESTLLVGIGATAGRVAFLKGSATGNQQLTCLVTGTRMHPRFLAWQLFARQEELRATAPFTTLPILNNEFVRSLVMVVPSLAEQTQTADRLDDEARRTSALIQRETRQIILLQERRQALITAAVTGQLDIPEAA
jgi:type I restriction enzyme S subunit